MIKCFLNKLIKECNDFNALDIDWEFVFKPSKFSVKARERRRQRGTNKFPKIYRLVRILSEIDIEILRHCPDVEWCEEEKEDEPLYSPNDPQGLDYAWTKQTLTHATNQTAFDIEKGNGIVIGIIESSGNGANYTDSELGGTGNQATDWIAIQNGTHANFVNYTNPQGQSINPYGTGHGDGVCRQAISVMDNAVTYCGSCPNGKVMMAVGQNFDEAIQRMANLGVDVISVSYTNCYSHRTAIQYAVAAGVIVVYAHGNNTHAELTYPLPFEAITVGGFSLTDVSERSYGQGLTVVSRGPSGSAESYSTPSVAGICGLLLAKNPTWNIYDVWSALIQICQKPIEMGGLVWDIEYGWGIPEAYASLQLLLVDLKPLPVIDFAVSTTTFGINLSWKNLSITNFNHFEIRRKLNSAPLNETDGTLVYSGIALSCYDKLALSGNWYYGIWAVDIYNRYSDYVDYVKKNVSYTAPIPVITSISDTNTTVTVTWDNLSAEGYKVFWDTDSGVPYVSSFNVGNVTTYTIPNLTLGQTYYVTITAYDDEGNETDYADEVISQTGISSISAISATMLHGLLSMNLPTITDIDFVGYTIIKRNLNKTLKTNLISNRFVDTQAKIGDSYEITAKDSSGNTSGKWTIMVNINSLTIATKGG